MASLPSLSGTLFVALASSACVPSVPHFVTNAEARSGRPYPNAEYGAARLPLPPQQTTLATSAGHLSVPGYWHWDGLEYVFVAASSEIESPAYLWRWQNDSRGQ